MNFTGLKELILYHASHLRNEVLQTAQFSEPRTTLLYQENEKGKERKLKTKKDKEGRKYPVSSYAHTHRHTHAHMDYILSETTIKDIYILRKLFKKIL